MADLQVSLLPLSPLGAVDLIDRAVRLYRRHFFTLIRIAAPPVLVSALGSTLTTISFRALSAASNNTGLALYFLVLLAGGTILLCRSVFRVVVLGGVTRHL